MSGGNGRPVSSPTFGDRLTQAVAERESQIVLGIDPDPARLWPAAIEATSEARAHLAIPFSEAEAAAGESPPTAGAVARLEAAAAVLAHCRALVDAAGPACAAVKPQLACFERLGAPGWAALSAVVAHARAAGLLVLADGKRGDIAVSAAAYGPAVVGSTPTPFGDGDGLRAAAYPASPYLGIDTLEELLEAARAARAGMFVLVRTSNPGAADLQDAELAGGRPLWERVAGIVHDLGAVGLRASTAATEAAASDTPAPAAGGGASQAPATGAAPGPLPGATAGDAGSAAAATGTPARATADCGLHDVGAVVGATAPEHVARMRDLMPRTVFLLPGIGAQGGRVEDLAPAFAPHRAAALVTASRSIATAHERAAGASPAAAARAEADRLRAAAWALA